MIFTCMILKSNSLRIADPPFHVSQMLRNTEQVKHYAYTWTFSTSMLENTGHILTYINEVKCTMT